MTTAHRPTFDPARGREAQRGPAYHQRLLAAHTHLKHRKAGQGGIGGIATEDASADQGRSDLRAELLKAEAAVKAKKDGGAPAADLASLDAGGNKRKLDGAADDTGGAAADPAVEEHPEAKRRRLILEEARAVDADSDDDDAAASSEEEDSDEDEDDEDDDEDEEEELMRELAKIKAERAAAKAAEDEAKAKEEEDKREFDIARGNPLLNKQDFGVKRRWDDDVVFRNQGRGTEERGKRKEFVNDLLRSDFHKKFMSRYVR